MNALESPAGNASGLGNYNTWPHNAVRRAGRATISVRRRCRVRRVSARTSTCSHWFGASPSCAATGYSPAPYYDAYQVVNAHFGQAAVGATERRRTVLLPEHANPDRAFGAGFSPYQVSDTNNNGSIVKLQYTKNFGSNAFVRVFGYTFYSDWLQTDPN